MASREAYLAQCLAARETQLRQYVEAAQTLHAQLLTAQKSLQELVTVYTELRNEHNTTRGRNVALRERNDILRSENVELKKKSAELQSQLDKWHAKFETIQKTKAQSDILEAQLREAEENEEYIKLMNSDYETMDDAMVAAKNFESTHGHLLGIRPQSEVGRWYLKCVQCTNIHITIEKNTEGRACFSEYMRTPGRCAFQ